MSFPLQQGSTPAVITPEPVFSTVQVLADTWQEKDNTAMKDYKGKASTTILSIFTDPGVDAQCTWILNTGQAPYTKGQSITPTTDTVSSPRTFLIVDVDNGKYGGEAVEQKVKLRVKVSQTGLS
jgi:hypothetical protein